MYSGIQQEEVGSIVEAIPVKTRYLRRGEDYLEVIVTSLKREVKRGLKLEDGDFVVVSEKFIATGEGNLVDEREVKVGPLAYLCYLWSKYLWGYILGPLLRTRPDRIENLRRMPREETLRHKQVVIEKVGLLYALKPASEGGVDLTNVPGSYAVLLPRDPERSAERIHSVIKRELGVDVVVMVVDTDATYRFLRWYVTALPCAIGGIVSGIGVMGYILGKLAGVLKIGGLCGATPLAIAGNKVYKKYSLEEILHIAEVSDRCRADPSKSIHQYRERCGTFEISEELLEKMEHTPIVVVKGWKN